MVAAHAWDIVGALRSGCTAAFIPGGHHRVWRQPVDLRLVEQQEECAVVADAVLRITSVEPSVGDPGLVQPGQPGVGPFPQLVQRPELDGVRRAGLGAGRLLPDAEPVVAQRALPRPTVLFALVDDP